MPPTTRHDRCRSVVGLRQREKLGGWEDGRTGGLVGSWTRLSSAVSVRFSSRRVMRVREEYCGRSLPVVVGAGVVQVRLLWVDLSRVCLSACERATVLGPGVS